MNRVRGYYPDLGDATTDAIASAIGSNVQQLAQQAIARVTVRSSFSPDYSFSPFVPTPPGAPIAESQAPPSSVSAIANQILRRAQPEVLAQDANGNVLFSWHPYGSPAPNAYVPRLVGVGAIGVGLAALLFGKWKVGLAALAAGGALVSGVGQ